MRNLMLLVAALSLAVPVACAKKEAGDKPDKPAPEGGFKRGPADMDKPAPVEKDKPAPVEKDKPAPVGKDKPAPAGGAWQASPDQKTWEPVALPHTGWRCNRCDRFYKTIVDGKPASVKFRFASDNQARMLVNGKAVFEEFFKEKFCTDAPCCGKCCDSDSACRRIVANGKTYELSAEALAAFKDGPNEVIWEVHQDAGGSGFHVEMDVGR